MRKTLGAFACVGLLGGCVSFAAPGPIATFGGPETAGRHRSELGLAAGIGGGLFPNAHTTGNAWWGRYRFGVTDKLDIGVDVLGAQRAGGKATGTFKLAAKLRVHRYVALELGVGAADDSDGKSVNADGAIIFGTDRRKVWDFYGAGRMSGALGIVHNSLDSTETGSTDPSANVGARSALFFFGTAGAQARLTDWARFVIEGGVGAIVVRDEKDPGLGLYLGCGLLFRTPAPKH